jgi:hypothetical protein
MTASSPDPATLTAALFGLVAAPTRSLLWVLLASLVGYGLGVAILQLSAMGRATGNRDAHG